MCTSLPWQLVHPLQYEAMHSHRQAIKNPEAVVDYLLHRPWSEIEAKRAEVLRVRARFFYHSNASREGATKHLIKEMCAKPEGKRFGGASEHFLSPIYRARPKDPLTVGTVRNHIYTQTRCYDGC